MPHNPEDRCRHLVDLLTKHTGIAWTFGYLGNVYSNGDDDRRYFAFAAHPGRVGTHKDRIGGFSDPAALIPLLQGAVQLAIVQKEAR